MTKKIIYFAFFMLSNIYLLSARQTNNKSFINLNDAFNKSEPIYFIGDSTEREKLEQLSKVWMDAMISHDTSTLKYLMAAAFILWRNAVDEAPDYVIYMFTVALGFAAAENMLFLLTFIFYVIQFFPESEFFPRRNR